MLNFCFSKINLGFFAFRSVLTILGLLLICSTIKYYKVNPNVVIGLYMAHLFFMDTIQMRNFLAECIVLFSTRYLVQTSKISYLKYVMGIFFASFFHVIAWFYLVLLAVKFFKKAIAYNIIFIIAIAIFAMCYLFRSPLQWLVQLAVQIMDRGYAYEEDVSGIIFSPLIALGTQCIAVLPLYLYKNEVNNIDARKKLEFIYRLEIVMFLLLPTNCITSSFNRLFRNLLILDTIGLSLLYENVIMKTGKKSACIFQILLVGGWLVVDLYRDTATKIMGMILEYNLFAMPISTRETVQCMIIIAFSLLLIFLIKRFLQQRKGVFARKTNRGAIWTVS